MKRPVNFETIDAVDFEIDGIPFYTDLDNLQNKKESSWVWVFCNGQLLGDYAVLFELKWEHDCYSMKKCVLGEGTTGDYIFQDNWISTKWIKTKNDFMEYIKRLIISEVEIGKFKN